MLILFFAALLILLSSSITTRKAGSEPNCFQGLLTSYQAAC